MKVLHVVSCLDDGGVETILKGLIGSHRDLGTDFVFVKHCVIEGIFEKDLLQKGYRVFYIPGKRDSAIKHLILLFCVIRSENPDCVHVHMNEGSWFDLFVSRLYGVKVRVAHIHLSIGDEFFLKNLVRRFNAILTKVFSTRILSCSTHAAKELGLAQRDFIFFPSKIALEKYIFSNEIRLYLRELHGFNREDIVLGLTARLFYQKNQLFVLRVLLELPLKYKLVLIGGGEDETMLKSFVNEQGLMNRVLFTGSLSLVEQWYSAFDIFVMPSLFEGFGISLLEAQVNGLTCIISNVFPQEVRVNDNLFEVELSTTEWARTIMNADLSRKVFNYSLFSQFDSRTLNFKYF